jgi:hypothetical protein
MAKHADTAVGQLNDTITDTLPIGPDTVDRDLAGRDRLDRRCGETPGSKQKQISALAAVPAAASGHPSHWGTMGAQPFRICFGSMRSRESRLLTCLSRSRLSWSHGYRTGSAP